MCSEDRPDLWVRRGKPKKKGDRQEKAGIELVWLAGEGGTGRGSEQQEDLKDGAEVGEGAWGQGDRSQEPQSPVPLPSCFLLGLGRRHLRVSPPLCSGTLFLAILANPSIAHFKTYQ